MLMMHLQFLYPFQLDLVGMQAHAHAPALLPLSLKVRLCISADLSLGASEEVVAYL